MKHRLFPMVFLVAAAAGCGSEDQPGAAGTTGTGTGSGGTGSGGVTSAGGTAGSGMTSSGGVAGGGGGAGGAPGGAGSGGNGGGAGTGGAGSGGYELDCGPSGIALEGHGPPENRINYVIVGDGYTSAELDGVYLDHLNTMLQGRFSAEQQPYLRYRKFVNICALKVPSVDSGVVEVDPPPAWGETCADSQDTAFDGCGNTDSRLGYLSNQKVDAKIQELLPSNIEVDWKAVVFNAAGWWNAGGSPMIWSGAHEDANLAAQHEGGHTFFRLADEYGGTCSDLPEEGDMRINVTLDSVNTAGKWPHWLGTTQDPGTGLQQAREGGQYCDTGVFSPSEESVMNSLWASSYFNSISLEWSIHEIYDIVDPIDSFTPETTTTPRIFEVRVIDPAVIKIEWSVDGSVISADGGETLDVAALGLAAGSHTISARAYDDTPWVPADTPHGRDDLEQTVEWTVTVP